MLEELKAYRPRFASRRRPAAIATDPSSHLAPGQLQLADGAQVSYWLVALTGPYRSRKLSFLYRA